MASARMALASSLRLGIGRLGEEEKMRSDFAGRRVARAAIVADDGGACRPPETPEYFLNCPVLKSAR